MRSEYELSYLFYFLLTGYHQAKCLQIYLLFCLNPKILLVLFDYGVVECSFKFAFALKPQVDCDYKFRSVLSHFLGRAQLQIYKFHTRQSIGFMIEKNSYSE